MVHSFRAVKPTKKLYRRPLHFTRSAVLGFLLVQLAAVVFLFYLHPWSVDSGFFKFQHKNFTSRGDEKEIWQLTESSETVAFPSANLLERVRRRWVASKLTGVRVMWDLWRSRNPNLQWPPVSLLASRLEPRNHDSPTNMDKFPWAFPGKGRDQVLSLSSNRSVSSRAQVVSSASRKETEHHSAVSAASHAVPKSSIWRGMQPVPIALLVHNRPVYLRETLTALSKVEGIEDTLLLVSHDGFFTEVDTLVRSVRFCRTKQVLHPFSPHLFTNSFPAAAAGDCSGDGVARNAITAGACIGQTDQNRQYRDPRRVALKHHWWWLLNNAWDFVSSVPDPGNKPPGSQSAATPPSAATALSDAVSDGGLSPGSTQDRATPAYSGFILFLEEDHYVMPNGLGHLAALVRKKDSVCPECLFVSLAPAKVTFWGSSRRAFVKEAFGNIGYAMDRSTQKKIVGNAESFCLYDDYNWDVSLTLSVLATLGTVNLSSITLRWSRASAVHFGACGMHVRLDSSGASAAVTRGGGRTSGTAMLAHAGAGGTATLESTRRVLGEDALGTSHGRREQDAIDDDREGRGRDALHSNAERGRKGERQQRYGEGAANQQQRIVSAAGSSPGQCSDLSILQMVKASEQLFRENVDEAAPVVDSSFRTQLREGFQGWGGWGDGRDAALCLWMAGRDGPWSNARAKQKP